ncbi:MAG: hypothetical protein RR101_15035 [Burkholderiaceae bacterium]
MPTITVNWSAPSALTVSGLATLGSGASATSATLNLTGVDPTDLVVELEATPGTVSGNKQALVYLKSSFDGTSFSTDAGDVLLGALALPTNATQQRAQFSVSAALGWVPPYLQIRIVNESGAALTAAACDTITQTGVST